MKASGFFFRGGCINRGALPVTHGARNSAPSTKGWGSSRENAIPMHGDNFNAVVTFFRLGTTTPDRDLSVHPGREMLPNVAKFGYGDDDFWGRKRSRDSFSMTALLWTKKSLSLHSTAPHLRMLRAR